MDEKELERVVNNHAEVLKQMQKCVLQLQDAIIAIHRDIEEMRKELKK